MGHPQRSDHALRVSWMPPAANGVLLLCPEEECARIELVRPQLELQGLYVQVVSNVQDAVHLRGLMDAMGTGCVVSVVVGENADRWSVRRQLDAFSAVGGPNHRLFVLHLRQYTSVLRQVRALTRAVDGLRRTLEIDRESSACLTASATMRATAVGERTVAGAASARGLQVVLPPVLLQGPLHAPAEVIPSQTRYPSEQPRRPFAETQPDLQPPDDY